MLNRHRRRVHQEQQQLTPERLGQRQTAASGITVQQRINRQRPREAELLSAVGQLDVITDPHVYQQLMQWIVEQYNARQGGTLMGLFAKCYLGPPFVDHRLDLLGSICEHYRPGDAVPMPYGQARGLAQSGAYAHIELYSDGAMVPILPDGTAVDL